MHDQILLQEISPNGHTQVTVECDTRTCFMYLSGAGAESFRTCTVWVRNLSDAPEELDVDGMKRGEPPQMPIAWCRHPKAQPPPAADNLRVIWLPEGNGVALLERDDYLAVIPPWSGVDGFDGYARDCVGEGPVAWELTADNVLRNRFADADAYWAWWDQNPWPEFQDAQIAALEKTLGSHTNYYAIDGGEWPPKAMLRFQSDECQILATIGLSLRPQPNVEMSLKDPAPFRRIELGIQMRPDLSESDVRRLGSRLSGLSNYPWESFTWFGHGHTIPFDVWSRPQYSYAAFTDLRPTGAPIDFETVRGDPVNLLWLVPITVGEQKLAASKSTDELLRGLPSGRWREA